MSKYIMRLDDSSEYADVKKWQKMEEILDKYCIKPIVGIIPNNQDSDMCNVYMKDNNFWAKVNIWQQKGWTMALHGYTHVFETNNGGINPVNLRSEFANLPLDRQKEKIRKGYETLREHGICPKVFFAPAHTFDKNTLLALKQETTIKIISDTVANDAYYQNDFYFIPQQSGYVRRLPFKLVTFCYHPNMMNETDFELLEAFLKKHMDKFVIKIPDVVKKRKKNLYDRFLQKIYFIKRRVKQLK